MEMPELAPETKELDVAVVSPCTSRRQKRVEFVQFFALLVAMFGIGYTEGHIGPLLPCIQAEYDVNFIVVSTIFILNMVGCLVTAVSGVYLTQRLRFGKVVVIGGMFQAAAFIIESTAPPFPAFVISFGLVGFGLSLQDSQINGYTAALKDNSATKMGILHAVYGVGALVSPTVSTQFAQKPRWSFFYITSVGVAVISVSLLIAVFRFHMQDECLQDIGQPPADTSDNEENHYMQIIRLKTVWLLGLFLFCYVGVEVTMGSWTVTYIIQVRNGGPWSGYISTGFFGGIALGPIALLWVNRKVGEDKVPFIYILIAIALQLIIWFVPSLILNAVCVALIGIVLGPMFTIAINQAGRLLPPWLLTGSISIMAGFWATGSATVPFITGVISSKAGVKAMPPVMVGMLGMLFCLWGLVYLRSGLQAKREVSVTLRDNVNDL